MNFQKALFAAAPLLTLSNTQIVRSNQYNFLPKEIKEIVMIDTVHATNDFKELVDLYRILNLVSKETNKMVQTILQFNTCRKVVELYQKLKNSNLHSQKNKKKEEIKRYFFISKNKLWGNLFWSKDDLLKECMHRGVDLSEKCTFTIKNLMQALIKGTKIDRIYVLEITINKDLEETDHYVNRLAGWANARNSLSNAKLLPPETHKSLNALIDIFIKPIQLKIN